MATGIRLRFPVLAGSLQIIFIILFAVFAEYDETAQPNGEDTSPQNQYAIFQDVHAAIFIGFGFLITFLKRYGYTAVGVNFLIAAICIQWATLMRGFLNLDEQRKKFPIHIGEMVTADLATATVLISFGACLGKASPSQLIIMAFIEIILAQANEKICLSVFRVTDAGLSMFVHVFGAYFGLAAARVLCKDGVKQVDGEGKTYHSDVFAMIGTIFLWIYWPSFNGATSYGVDQNRAFINTYFAMTSCCVITFVMSWIVDGKFNMLYVQNATLAGGVAIGTSADLMIRPHGSLVIGAVAAFISVLGYKFLSPALFQRYQVHDTRGVLNLHGIPGLLGGVIGAFMAYFANGRDYGMALFDKFPARLPGNTTGEYYEQIRAELGLNTTQASNSSLLEELDDMINSYNYIQNGRTSSQQAGFQLAALALTLAIAIIGGALTGFVLQIPIAWDPLDENNFFEDDLLWTVAPFDPLLKPPSSPSPPPIPPPPPPPLLSGKNARRRQDALSTRNSEILSLKAGSNA